VSPHYINIFVASSRMPTSGCIICSWLPVIRRADPVSCWQRISGIDHYAHNVLKDTSLAHMHSRRKPLAASPIWKMLMCKGALQHHTRIPITFPLCRGPTIHVYLSLPLHVCPCSFPHASLSAERHCSGWLSFSLKIGTTLEIDLKAKNER
jgi:hypothetical protein